MPSSAFQEWWRNQLAQNPQRSVAIPICPCRSCFEGTGHTSAVKIPCKRPSTMTSLKRRNSKESVASDMVPLCSDVKWTPGTSSETLVSSDKEAR
ncbi:hypothetical protein F5X99DRAFT_266303 [Biscogniauxia marginata]|nr:hypothetical protein F5X99DRAFT_266303 [Biscogniauxia marginata]